MLLFSIFALVVSVIALILNIIQDEKEWAILMVVCVLINVTAIVLNILYL